MNPAIITAQMRGAIIMGLSAALKEQVRFAKGGVESSNFGDYELLRMNEIPAEIEVHDRQEQRRPGRRGRAGASADRSRRGERPVQCNGCQDEKSAAAARNGKGGDGEDLAGKRK